LYSRECSRSLGFRVDNVGDVDDFDDVDDVDDVILC
jgi:hypothetical protein